ncbi:Fatty acyl-CoA reductase [Neorhodopirellula pilleata]|uniref:Fatty acyl-CoA reductase n=2 Tax=Neorhodopirellula pilleata TaxID=2714738 RepID=A0A5C5ZUG6_9BACT|nr:Fatty acyl-CoA reductase [Neorhodopirellula pilleata]
MCQSLRFPAAQQLPLCSYSINQYNNSLEKSRMSTTLITGASSGIGAELARLFAAGGDDLVLVARGEEKLRELASTLEAKHGVRATVMAADLSKHEACERLVQRLRGENLLVDHLVNNAGFGALGDFAELPVDRQVDMLQVNVVALTMLSRLLLPEMILRGRGGILNVGSIAAYQAGPHMAVYYATKAYVLSFTEALREELINTPLHITLLAPGPTSTGFGEDSGMGDLAMFASGAMPVAEVAKAGYDGYRKNQDVVIPGWKNRLMVTSTSFLPRIATRKLVGRLQNPSGRETT